MDFHVIIRCPATGREVPTGITTDIATFSGLPKHTSKLECPVCGEVHVWSRKDVFLAYSTLGLEGASSEQAAGK
jgi:predicted RNA-binding Zn-ribbon protein involved in translation (DUF1610 family)